jgi:YD repeat-containing protein
MRKWGIVALCVTLAALAPDIAGATCGVTKSSYEALQMLMTYSAVVKTLGCEGEQVSRREDPGMVSTTYMWDGANRRSTITLTFGNGELMGRSQTGLD